ncbi:hypothetical protein D3C84_1166220 [compost metagenome]
MLPFLQHSCQLPFRNGLNEQIIHSQLQKLDAILHQHIRGERYDRHEVQALTLSQFLSGLITIHLRHMDIHDNQLPRLLLSHF